MVCKVTDKINQKAINVTFVLYVMIYSEVAFAQITRDKVDILVDFFPSYDSLFSNFLL